MSNSFAAKHLIFRSKCLVLFIFFNGLLNFHPHRSQIFGVIQILRIRKKNFEDAFELDRNTLFNHFVGMIQTALTK